jgi:3-methyladenine DNA glycosylase AlkD
MMPGAMLATTILAGAVRDHLRAAADPVKAPVMQRYMKSLMPYLGVPLPRVREIARKVFAAHPLPDRAAWEAAILELWREARFREERYAALELAAFRAYRAYQDPDTMPLYEKLIVTGAWWDYVDEVGIHRIGPILGRHPEPMAPLMRTWSRDPDLWKRRTSIICQIGSKAGTDTTLLTDCIDANLSDRDFFIRKAIGWALRDYSKTDPTWVRAFIEERGERLSPLSRREGLKYA